MKRCVFCALFFALSLFLIMPAARAANNSPAELRRAEIRAAWEEYRPAYEGSPYTEAPALSGEHSAGALNPGYVADAVNMVNYFRFLAGLPTDVELDADMCELAQHGAALMAANRELSHVPSRPSGMPEGFYSIGYEAASDSNLAKCRSLTRAVELFMLEPGENNKTVGHRRFVLSPVLKKTGFGFANSYATMYIRDKSGVVEYPDFVCWPNGPAFPAQSFPAESIWSFHYNPELFEAGEMEITVTRDEDNTAWVINGSLGELNLFSGGFSYRPDAGSVGDEYKGVYSVRITGLKLKATGEPMPPLKYDVEFFDLFGVDEDISAAVASFSAHSAESSDAPLALDVLEDYNRDITRLEFAAMLVDLIESGDGEIELPGENPFSDTDDENAQKAYMMGLMSGVSAGVFSPDTALTRAQAAVVIYSLYGRPSFDEAEAYGDDDMIPAWARDAVYFCRAAGIMGAEESDSFSPGVSMSILHTVQTLFSTDLYK